MGSAAAGCGRWARAWERGVPPPAERADSSAFAPLGFVDRGAGPPAGAHAELGVRRTPVPGTKPGSLAPRPTRRARERRLPRGFHTAEPSGSRAGRGCGSGSARGLRAPRRLLAGAEETARARGRRGNFLLPSPAALCPQALASQSLFPICSFLFAPGTDGQRGLGGDGAGRAIAPFPQYTGLKKTVGRVGDLRK